MKRRLQTTHLLVFSWLLAAAGAFAQTPLANFSFSGNAQNQVSGGSNAVVHGATLTQDRFGQANRAFNFDGTQGYLEVANSAALNTPFTTVSFWAKATALPAQGEVYLLSFGGWQERWKISLPAHGKPIWTTNAATISDMDAGDGHTLDVGVWKHVVFVHDGTKDIIYMDGVLAAEKNVTGNLNSTNRPLGIGYNPIDGGNFFNGALDDIQIFGVALNAIQVAALYATQSLAPTSVAELVASYTFSNSTLDATSYANTAVATDVKSTTDRFGYGNSAYEFNGVSSKVVAANSAQLNSPYTTVSFWVKPNALPASGEAFLLSLGGYQDRFKISVPSHGKVVFTTNATSGISDMDAGGGHELKVGEWTHVVAVHDGTNDKIFIDGALANSKTVAGTLNNTNRPLGIGFDPIDNANWFNGSLDDIQIYNYALTDVAIAALYTTQSTFLGNATDLVADYSFSGNTRDESQFGNHATGNAQLTNDRFGYASNAYHFDGSNSLTAANSVQLNSDYATVSMWVKADEFPASGEVFLLSNGGYQDRYKISMPGHGKPVFTTNSTSGISDMDSGTPLTVGQWQHVAFVHDGTSDKIFINGMLVNSKAVSGTLKSTTRELGIGFDPIGGGNFFKGSLDEIQIYNRALTDVEIATLYAEQNQTPTFAGDLIANYTFDEGNADDHTEYHNNAQVEGAQLANDRFNRANHAYEFDGQNDKITAPNSPQQNSEYTTVSFWVNVKNLPATGEAFLMSNGGYQERWKISLPAHGKVVWTTNNSSGISDMDAGGGHELQTGTWMHVVTTHDGNNDKIFINGVLANSKAVAGPLNSTTKVLGIGYNPIDNANFFNGSLDEVRIYNRALTDVEVAALYAEQSISPTVSDAEAPSAPLNLTAAVSFTSITLTWFPSTDNVGVAAYNVYQDGAKIQTTSSTTVTLTGLTPLTDFVFGVSAVDSAGNESAITTINATSGEDQTPDITPPTPPGNLMGTAGAHSVLLSFEASTDDRNVAGYVVTVDGVFYDSLAANVTSVLVNGLDPETPYTFEIYAFDNAGNNSGVSSLDVTTEQEINTGEEGLVAWYPFEGNANDATPYANHGVIGGNPVFEPAGHPNGGGQNIKFDGDQDSVLAPNAVQLISDYTTVSFWIRVDDTNINDAEAYVLDFGHWSQRWKISLPQHHKIVWTTNGNNAQFPSFISDMDSGDGNELVPGFWWYVTMVHDGTNDQIYINGELANSKPVPTKLNSTGRPLGMGNNPIEGGQYFQGALDELKIYNKALVANEIMALYNTGTTGTQEGPNAALLQQVQGVYPNPAVDQVWVKHSFDNQQALLVRISDVQGRQVGDLRFNRNEIPTGQFPVNVSTYPAGTYFLNFVVEGKSLGSVKFDKK